MNTQGIYWSIAAVFVPLSFVTIGGGQSAIADIQRQAVEVHHWMSDAEFLDIFAISRMAPGPGSLIVTLIGWKLAGFWGAVVGTLAIFGPTSFMIWGVAHLWRRYRGARWQVALEAGLRPVSAGMLLSAGYVLLQALGGGVYALLVAGASTALLLATRVNPLLVIGGGAGIFVLLHRAALL